jgi:REP element-mobilizing transposase RayT
VKQSRVQRPNVPHQRQLEFPRHGGARKGAGRKPKGRAAGPSHARRPATKARHPLLVTQRLCSGLPSLRKAAEFEVLLGAIAAVAERDGFRIVHFSVQTNHLHYICEARNSSRLTSGMRSLGVMIARRLNQLWQHTGSVFAERFHARALETPNEVRHALAYVLNNARKHVIIGDAPDPFSSGPWFDGWKPEACSKPRRTSDASTPATPSLAERVVPSCIEHGAPAAQQFEDWELEVASKPCTVSGGKPLPIVSSANRGLRRCVTRTAPTAAAKTWLLSVGWRRRGLIDWRQVPSGQAAQRARARDETRCADSIQRSLAAAARSANALGQALSVSRPKPTV